MRGILLSNIFDMYMVHIFIRVLIVYEVITICFLLLFVYYRLVNIVNTKKIDYLAIIGYLQQSTEGVKYKFSVTNRKLCCENIFQNLYSLKQ
jgi:hypothetical protein